MNSKNIKKHLKAKVRDWVESIDNEDVKKTVLENTIVTGGALVSLLTGEPVHDYDVYFKTKEACANVAQYYIRKWNTSHPEKQIHLKIDDEAGKISCFIRSSGIADENEEVSSPISYNFESTEEEDEAVGIEHEQSEPQEESKDKYRPRFITSNAITLSDKIQIVTRFYGNLEEIHKNYDFAHCTCAWSSWDNEVFLPQKALECIINKELYYIGSKYPLCSIIRTRKYLERGYHINAGQYVKMCMQLNLLDLTNVEVLEDQLTGVDTTYFQMMIEDLQKHQEELGTDKVDTGYAMQLINKLF